jgi:SulP family sulfate permease
MNYLKSIFKKNKKYFKADFLAGITVALALIPESVAFAFVAGVTPLLSLQTAVMIGLIAAIFTGRPGMISSSTAAISVVFAPLIAGYGLDYLFLTVILTGIIQILIGVFKLGKFTSIIPHSVVLGFLNGLAILIFIAQFNQFKVDGAWLPAADLAIMLGFVLLTMAIIYFFPKITKAIPSALVGIVSVSAISILLSKFGIYDLVTVQDFAGGAIKGELPSFYLPNIPFNLEVLKVVFPYAFIAALVGLTEATLTLKVIDEITETRGKINKEYFAQGLANFVNGFFGGMGGDAMVGQSLINVKSGGRTRLSALTAAVALFIFLMFFSGLVNLIPLASLIGLMFMVVISTFVWETLKYGRKIPFADFCVIIAVSVVTIFFDLATAVIVGVVLSSLIFAWEKGKKLSVRIQYNEKKGYKIYKINGIIFFGSIENFKSKFNYNNDPSKVVLDLKYAKVMDYSAVEAINNIAEKYSALNKSFVVTRPGENCLALLNNAENITSIKIKGPKYDPTD